MKKIYLILFTALLFTGCGFNKTSNTPQKSDVVISDNTSSEEKKSDVVTTSEQFITQSVTDCPPSSPDISESENISEESSSVEEQSSQEEISQSEQTVSESGTTVDIQLPWV